MVKGGEGQRGGLYFCSFSFRVDFLPFFFFLLAAQRRHGEKFSTETVFFELTTVRKNNGDGRQWRGPEEGTEGGF